MSINSKKKPEQHITEKRSHGSHYRNEVQYNGLINQGATCYLNAVLQSLFMTPEFREAVGSHEAPGDCSEENLLLQLQKLFINLSENAATTQGITRSLGVRNVYEQQDAVEYYRKILKAVGTQASKVFEGKMNNITKCGQCGNETTETSAFISILLSIDAGNDNYDMGKSLKTFFEHSKLEEDDWMYCEICDHKTETETWSEIDEYPTVLTLHLKRFDFDYIQMRYKKNECRLDVPLSLPKEDNWPVYDLYAVINHMGGYSSGHYDTIIRSFENGTWYCFDDYNVTQTSEASLENSSLPYMLMYRKSMLNPDSIKTAALNPGSIEMEVLNPDSVKTAALNPDSIEKVALNPGSIKTAASNPGSIEIVALNQYSIKTAALNSDSIETAASNQDSIKTAASNPDSIKTAATNPDSIETAASNPDSIKTAALNPDSIKTAALNPDSIKTAALNPGSIEMEVLNPDNIKTAASNQDSIKTAASNPDSIETAASNPDSIKMAASNPDSIKTAASNQDSIKTAASNQDSIKTAASNPDSIETAASNQDSIKTAASNPDSIKTAASNPDSIETAASNQDSIKTAASNPDSIKTAASNPDSIETAASNQDSIKTAASNPDSIETAASNQDSIKTAASNQDSIETAALNPDSIHQPMRILLMGPSRAGKSTVGNIILGGNHFPSKSGSETVTKESMVKTVENVTVVDTPNLFSLDKSSWEKEMKKCVKLSDPGPDVILWVTPISKFSEQQQGLFHTLKKRLDPRTTKRMMIIFTHGRELKKLGQRIDRFISYCKKLCKVVRCCQNRYHVIDITDGHNYTSELLEKLSEMVTKEATAITQRQLKCLRRRSLKKKTKKGE